jgi:hypothetical protein
MLDERLGKTGGGGVNVSRIIEDNKPFVEKYDPGHPDADENGLYPLPNVNIVEEMVNMISASRSFEANATAVRHQGYGGYRLEIGRRFMNDLTISNIADGSAGNPCAWKKKTSGGIVRGIQRLHQAVADGCQPPDAGCGSGDWRSGHRQESGYPQYDDRHEESRDFI